MNFIFEIKRENTIIIVFVAIKMDIAKTDLEKIINNNIIKNKFI